MLMPHESTTRHDDSTLFIPSNLTLNEALSVALNNHKTNNNTMSEAQAQQKVEAQKRKVERKDSKVPHPFPEEPKSEFFI